MPTFQKSPVLPASSPGTKLLQAYPPLESSLCIVINSGGALLPSKVPAQKAAVRGHMPASVGCCKAWGTMDICGPYAIPVAYPSLCSTDRNNELGELKRGSSHSILEEAYGFREMTVAQQNTDEIQRKPSDFLNYCITGLIASSVTHTQM